MVTATRFVIVLSSLIIQSQCFTKYFYPIKGILSSWTSISIDLLSLVRFLSTNYIRIRCHSIISHFTMSDKCRYCGLSFKQNSHRLRHERNSHSDDQSVRCVICEQIFQETTDLHQHVDKMLIRTEHYPVRPVSKHSVLNDTFRYIKTHFTTTRTKSTVSMPSMYTELRRQASTLPSRNAPSIPDGRGCGTT